MKRKENALALTLRIVRRTKSIGHALRDHVTNPQTFFEATSEQLPDVHFTIQQLDVVSMVAAMIREQRLDGILEGLRLAGLLNEVPNRRRAGSETDGPD